MKYKKRELNKFKNYYSYNRGGGGVTDNEMEVMQKLWMNGLSVRQIHAIFSKYSRDTVRRYVKDMKRLPRKMRKFPFADFKRTPDAITGFSVILNNDEAIKQKHLADLQQWRETFLRFKKREGMWIG